jgi:hypothetical protein
MMLQEETTTQDYVDALAGLMEIWREEFPKAIDVAMVAMEVVGDFGIATVARLKREAVQAVQTMAVATGEAVGALEPGVLRGKGPGREAKKFKVWEKTGAKIPTTKKKGWKWEKTFEWRWKGHPLAQEKGKAKRLAAAEAAETAVDILIHNIEVGFVALQKAGAGAALRLAGSQLNVAWSGIESFTKKGAKVFAEEWPKIIKAATDAVEAWGQSMLQSIDQLRQLREQIHETFRTYREEMDALMQGVAVGAARRLGKERGEAKYVPRGAAALPADIDTITTEMARDFADKLAKTTAEAAPIPSEQTARMYDLLIEREQAQYALAESGAAQAESITQLMTLLRQQASAEIQDIQDRLARETAYLEGYIEGLVELQDSVREQAEAEAELIEANTDRIEQLDKEIGILNEQITAVSGLAQLFEQIKDAINQTKLAGAPTGIGQVEELQRQTVEAMGEFGAAQQKFLQAQEAYRGATDETRSKLARAMQEAGAERATAAQRALALSQNLLQTAGGVFTVGSGEYLSIQRQVLEYQQSLYDAAKAAEEERKRLADELQAKQDERDKLQRDNETHQKNIEDFNKEIAGYQKITAEIQKEIKEKQDAARIAIDAVNKRLAEALAVQFPKLLAAQFRQFAELRAELIKQGLTPADVDRALADPQQAMLIVNKLQLAKLEEIRKATTAVVNTILGRNPGADVPGLQQGGQFVANKPTIFLAGERFQPERVRVEPLDRESQAMPLNFNVTINVGSAPGGREGGQRFARTAADALEAEMRLRLPRILEKRIA